jgi:hypothetical protein
MHLLITTLLTLSITVNACPDYKPLNQGDPAPCQGHFFNNTTEKRIRKDIRDGKLREQQIKLRDLQVKELKKDRDNWKEEARKQSEVSHSKDGDLTKGFLYGIGLTLAILFGVNQVSK